MKQCGLSIGCCVMSCMIQEPLLYGAMGFVILNSNLPNQTDSYALAFLYALLVALIKNINW